MPDAFSAMDAQFPQFSGGESSEQKIAALQNYMYMLLEQLRYVLRNLSPDNFNERETLDWIGRNIKAETIITNTVITNELYSEFGAIADLVVDELRTDYAKARNYLAGNTANVDYLHIHDEEIEFITDTYAGGTEQLHHGDRYFWWTDATMTQMTSEKETAYPVTVYTYTTHVKGAYRFDTVGGVKIPELVFGEGYGQTDANRGKGFLRKNPDSLDLWLLNRNGAERGIFIGDPEGGGYTDITGLRKPTNLDFSRFDSGYIEETVDGGATETFLVEFDASGNPVKLTDSSGHETNISWQVV